MNIDYGLILEKATKCQALIKQIIERFDDLYEIRDSVETANRNLAEIHALHKQLDQEGRSLFSKDMQAQLEYVRAFCERLTQVLGHESVSSFYSLDQFIKAIKES